MNKEQAINYLSYLKIIGFSENQINEIVKALEQQPCDDAISRQAVLNLTKELRFNSVKGMEDYCYRCIDPNEVEELPPIQPKAKVGKWIPTYGNVKCSVCGNVKDSRNVGKATHYCDFCGAKMESEGKE